jgi:hypothetical protein
LYNLIKEELLQDLLGEKDIYGEEESLKEEEEL